MSLVINAFFFRKVQKFGKRIALSGKRHPVVNLLGKDLWTESYFFDVTGKMSDWEHPYRDYKI